jgi:hypothetical protein
VRLLSSFAFFVVAFLFSRRALSLMVCCASSFYISLKGEELFYSDDYSRAKSARDDAARSASFFECYVFQTKTATPRYRAFSSSRFDTKSLPQNGGQTRASREENIKEKEGAQKLFSVPGIFSSRGRTL